MSQDRNQRHYLMLEQDVHPVIFTDLDGTLLDHDTYSAAEVAPLLHQLQCANIEVIPTTSKTQAELLVLCEQLSLSSPFIVENGAAVYLPVARFKQPPQGTLHIGDYWVKNFSQTCEHWLLILDEIEHEFTGLFTSFHTMSCEYLAQLTGLSQLEAQRAKQRQFGMPVEWLGDRDQKRQFIQRLEAKGATVLEGGRFVHISGEHDKGKAMHWLMEQYKNQHEANAKPLISIALGDSHNDIAMLEKADIAVRIASPHHERPQLTCSHNVIDSTEYGPQGWNSSIRFLLKKHL
ncbi:HAD-IIB family hydrolase [Vibrio algicola]|nr:HAD-IIB family hydrolase [Vibrio algicola]